MSAHTIKLKAVLLLMLFLAMGCRADTETQSSKTERVDTHAAPKSPEASAPIGHLGDVAMHLTDYQAAISETMILRLWQTGNPAPLAALKSLPLRHKVLLRALETRVIRMQFNKRALTRPAMMMEDLLAKAALGLRPDQHLSEAARASAIADLEKLEAQAVARFNAPFKHIKRVAADLVEHRVFADVLLDQAIAVGPKTAWTDEKTCLNAVLYRIPRVPTAPEIDKAVKELQTPMKTYYESNPRLFKTPARTFIRRLLLANTDASKDAVTKRRLEGLRKKVIDGGNMKDLVTEHGLPRDRRSGGRKSVSMSKRPDLHALSKGSVTAIEQHPNGWVFYRIEGHGEAVNRTFNDSRVQRELAAAVLRKENLLPTAKRMAGLLAYRLRGLEKTARVDDAFLKKHRIRKSTTGRFCKTSKKHVPSIGLAPDLVPIIFDLTMEQPVSNPARVRQDLVVAKLLFKEVPTTPLWEEEKAAYTAQWRQREAPSIVRKWLHNYSRQHRPRLDSKAVKALKTDALKWMPSTISGP